MRHCDYCGVEIKGTWDNCPLCKQPLNVNAPITSSSLPDVPLKFHRQNITRWLILLSLLIIFATFGLGLLYRGRIQWLQAALFGIMTMWLAVLTIIRKRRNLAKSLLYLLVILSLLCLYLDYLIGWSAWSTTYAIPIICSATVISMFITVRLTAMKPGDYVLYLATAEILGLVPIIFLLFDWVNNAIPAWISIALSALMLVLIIILRGPVIWREIKKRTFI